MVYESDFYTTRRPYRSTPAYSSYTVSKREIPWEKVPFVPRPSLVPDPVTAFGKKKTYEEVFKPERKNILSPAEKAKIKPKELIDPPKPYLSVRDINRQKILISVREKQAKNSTDSIDVLLPRLHKVAENPKLPYKRKIIVNSNTLSNS